MAISITFQLELSYNRINLRENLSGILTDVQIAELNETVTKTFSIENTYCAAGNVTGNKNNLEFQLDIYKDSTKQTLISSKVYSFVPNLESADNFVKQFYIHIKMKPEFAGAIDC